MALVAASADPEDFNSGKLYKLFTLSSVPGERPKEVTFPERRQQPVVTDVASMVCNHTWYGNSGTKFTF